MRVEAVSPVELRVTWDEVLPIDQNGIITTYELLSTPEPTFDDALVPEALNTTNMSLSLVDLHPYVNYTISVRAYTSVGAGPFEMVVQVTPEDRMLCKNFVFLSKYVLLQQVLLVHQGMLQPLS